MSNKSENNDLIGNIANNTHKMKKVVEDINIKIKNGSDLTEKVKNEVVKNKNKMEFVVDKLSKLLKTKDNSQLFTIMLLFGVIILEIIIWVL